MSERDELISAFAAGDMGEVEFTERALELGMELSEINEAINEVRAEQADDFFDDEDLP
jgi:hypothetical protein